MPRLALNRIAQHLPGPLRDGARRLYRRVVPGPPEPLMYRRALFAELEAQVGRDGLRGKRILEIGPRDGLDSLRLAGLAPAELVMIELPEKDAVTAAWRDAIACPHRYIEANLMYLTAEETAGLGRFALIWCTGVLYHNAEQLRMLRKLYKLLEPGGRLVLESATLRGPKALREGSYVAIHYPETYRDTGTITHLPTAKAIHAWLAMVGFTEVAPSDCFAATNPDLVDERMACIARKSGEDDAGIYYGKSGLNPDYAFGDST